MKEYFKHAFRYVLRPEYRSAENVELRRLKQLPRFVHTETSLFGPPFQMPDAASFVSAYNEIFRRGIYKFVSNTRKPYVIDCGANIGLSIVYFKSLYPDAEILAFEPDDKIFQTLRGNLEALKHQDVKLVKKALWHEETTLRFFSEGADGGTVVVENRVDNVITIETERLGKYLQNRTVDFLKIDIEGAETEVLVDCREHLGNVRNIFIEYHSYVNRSQSLNVIIDLLTQAGFRLHLEQGGLSSNQPFFERRVDQNMDLQLNIFAFRA